MRSMTGFGRASLEKNGRNYIIEIKTVNNKYNDISIRIPRSVSFMEEEIRKDLFNMQDKKYINLFSQTDS